LKLLYTKSKAFLHTEFEIKPPYDDAAIVAVIIVAYFLFTSLLSTLFCCKSKTNAKAYQFRQPDFSELGAVVASVKQLQREINELKEKMGKQPEGNLPQNSFKSSEKAGAQAA